MTEIPETTEGEFVSENLLPVPVSGSVVPSLTLEQAVSLKMDFRHYVSQVLQEGKDYGPPFPGGDKNTLLLPGAQNLRNFFGLEVSEPIPLAAVEDWNGGFFFYRYQVNILKNGKRVGFGIGSANSRESKWAFRWATVLEVPVGLDKATLKTRGGRISEFAFAVDKGETSGQYGKPAEYWESFRRAIADGTATSIIKTTQKGAKYEAWEIDQTLYRVPNPDIYDQVNTIDKMAQKRAFIAGIMMATGAAEYFTQDFDDDDSQFENKSPMPQPKPIVDPAVEAAQELGGVVMGESETEKVVDRTPAKNDWTTLYKTIRAEYGLDTKAVQEQVWTPLYGKSGFLAQPAAVLLNAVEEWKKQA